MRQSCSTSTVKWSGHDALCPSTCPARGVRLVVGGPGAGHAGRTGGWAGSHGTHCTRKRRSCTPSMPFIAGVEIASAVENASAAEIASAGREMPKHTLELTSKRRTW